MLEIFYNISRYRLSPHICRNNLHNWKATRFYIIENVTFKLYLKKRTYFFSFKKKNYLLSKNGNFEESVWSLSKVLLKHIFCCFNIFEKVLLKITRKIGGFFESDIIVRFCVLMKVPLSPLVIYWWVKQIIHPIIHRGLATLYIIHQ